MGASEDIFNAILLDLKDISVANGFSTDVAQVYTDRVRPEVAKTPGVTLWEGDMESPPDEIAAITGHSMQAYRFLLHVKSKVYADDLRKFKKDVRDAIERPTSNVNAVANAESATVVAASTPSQTSKDISNDRVFLAGEIEVLYHYVRGQA